LHDSYPKPVFWIRKVRDGSRAVLEEVRSYGVYTIGAQVKDAHGQWLGLEFSLSQLPDLPQRFKEPPDADQVRKRIIEFGTVLRERLVWFKYLNAYKTLHDVLHKLHDMQEAIVQAVDRFGGQPNNPVELQNIVNVLEDELVADASAANQNTEDPADAGQWLAMFAREVKNLRAALHPADLDALDRAVQALGALPNRQAELNKKLVRSARRLLGDDLVERMDGILAGLGQIPEGAELQAMMTHFRALCQQLAGLTMDHDACQEVETSLAVAGGLGKVTHDEVFGWPNVLASLLRIAARRPSDPKAARVAEYARTFKAAADPSAAAGPFALLREQFARLFAKTDEDLLKVTDKLVQVAALLDARLRRFA
jgi:hypothetical protein